MIPFIDSDKDSLEATKTHLLQSLRFPVIAVLAIWGAHILRLFFLEDAADYGNIPRTFYGLRGIVLSPLVHGSWAHLMSNTIPLFVLTALTFYFYRRVAQSAFWMIYFITGILVWFFARQVSHVGASGVVYGLVAFMFWNGIFRRSMRSIILSLMVLFFYSGMFAGIVPDQPGVSWESHLLGSLAGVFTAFWFKAQLEEDEVGKEVAFSGEQYLEKQSFLPPGIFEKTKFQRWQEAQEAARLRAEEEARRNQQPPFPPFWFTSY